MSRLISSLKGNYDRGTYVFPSSSTDGKGKLLSETNLKQITSRIVDRNYKYNKNDFILSVNGDSIDVSNGVAIINGYRVFMPNDSTVELSSAQSILATSGNTSMTFDLYLKLAKQTSTDTYVIDVDTDSDGTDTGAIYFELEVHDDTIVETIKDYLEANEDARKYKPAVYRFEDSTESTVLWQECDAIKTDDYTKLISDLSYTTSGWVIDLYEKLFVNKWSELDLSEIIELNAMTSNDNDTLALRLGTVTIVADTNDISCTTLNCTKKIDADDVFVGNTSLSEYLADSDAFIRTHGGNLISAIRDDEKNSEEVAYISTADTINRKYTESGTTYTDSSYLYVPYTYNGESCEFYAENPYDSTKLADYVKGDVVTIDSVYYRRNSVLYSSSATFTDLFDEFNGVKNDATDTKSIIECSYNSADLRSPNENVSSTDLLVGSQILNVTSMNDCYTLYGYNIITSEVDENTDSDATFVHKQCAKNRYYVGIKDGTDKTVPTDIADYDETKLSQYVEGDFVKNNSNIYKRNSVVYTSTKSFTDLFDYFIAFPKFGIYSNNTTNGASILINVVENTDTDRTDEFFDSARVIESVDIKSPQTRIHVDDNSTSMFRVDSYGAYYEENHDGDWNFVGFTDGLVDDNSLGEVKTPALTFFRKELSQSDGNLKDIDNATYMYLTYYDDVGNTVVQLTDNLNVNGFVRAQRVYNAVYNDYAEWYNSSNAININEGDVIYYNPETDEYDNKYCKAKTVVGICTENYGMIVGGDDITDMSKNREKFIPVSLCGRVSIKVNSADEYECGDYLYANGTNVASNKGEHIVGKFLKYLNDEHTLALAQVYLK